MGFTLCKAGQPLRDMELQGKEAQKRLQHTGNLFRKNLALKRVVSCSKRASYKNERFKSFPRALNSLISKKTRIAKLRLLYQSQIPIFPENGNSHYFLAKPLVTIVNKSNY